MKTYNFLKFFYLFDKNSNLFFNLLERKINFKPDNLNLF